MRDNYGFSLIEVLVAIAMISALFAVVTLPLKQENERQQYDGTITIMEEIREAILGKTGLYCNGQRQFTGYVADMGGLPLLVDEDGNEAEDLALEEQGRQTLRFSQPRALWTRDLNEDGDTQDTVDIPDGFCWRYYETFRMWAGWKGPYIPPPADGVLKDGWGNPLLFAEGEIITLKDATVVEWGVEYDIFGRVRWSRSLTVPAGAYRCKKDWAFPPGPDSDSRTKNQIPGFEGPYHSRWDECWETLPEDVTPPILEPKENYGTMRDTYRSVTTNLFYGKGTLCVVSYGADGAPGGEGYNKDIAMTIYRSEYTGEVAGMVGNSNENFADRVYICYPKYEQGNSRLVNWRHEILISRLNVGAADGCKNFRYGATPHVGDAILPERDWNTDIPMGIRSIRAGGISGRDAIYVFPVEPTGNFIGTIKVGH